MNQGRLPRQVFVDTSAIFAFASPRERDHVRARAIERALRRANVELICTNYIVAETHALILARAGRDLALATLRRMDSSAFSVVQVEPEDEIAARLIIERYTDKSFSLVGALSFVVMEALGISTAFSFDVNFRQYGFTTL